MQHVLFIHHHGSKLIPPRDFDSWKTLLEAAKVRMLRQQKLSQNRQSQTLFITDIAKEFYIEKSFGRIET
jgi:hypothetical protein